MVNKLVVVGGREYFLPIVEKIKVYAPNGQLVRNWQAVVEKGNWKNQYGIVSSRYTPIQHHDVIDITRKELNNIGREIQGEYIAFSGNNKSRMYYKVLLDKFDVNNNDFVGVGLMISNSYDRTLGLGVYGFAMRMFCMNQMVFGRELHSEFIIHVGDVGTRFDKVLKSMVHKFDDIATYLKVLVDVQVPYAEAIELVKERFDIADKYRKLIGRRIPYSKRVSLWDIYNAYTYIITHKAQFNEDTKITKLKQLNKVMIQTVQEMKKK